MDKGVSAGRNPLTAQPKKHPVRPSSSFPLKPLANARTVLLRLKALEYNVLRNEIAKNIYKDALKKILFKIIAFSHHAIALNKSAF